MDENLDNELKNRIREVFDNFEDPSADEGWLQLRKKYPEERANRRAFAWIWWSAAALLLLFMSISLWMFVKKDQTENFSAKNNKHPQSESIAANKKHSDTAVTTKPGEPAHQVITDANKIAENHPNTPETSSANKRSAAIVHINNSPSNKRGNQNTYQAVSIDTANKAVSTQHNQLVAAVTVNNLPPAASTSQKTQAPTNQPQQAQQQKTVAGQASSLAPVAAITKPKQQSKSINDMFLNTPPAKTEMVTSEKVRFSIYAATYVNYAKGSNKQFNTGVGFTSEISITSNLKFVTGVSIGQNTLSFDSGVPTSSAQTTFTTPGASNAFNTFSLNAKAVTVATVPVLTNYDASMVSLDIPLNLKYDFNPKKHNLYVLAGLSSGTFINETYTYQYNYPALLSPSLQQLQGETTHSSFSSFYFAKTLNLAMGVGYPVGKNHLVLEPFLKYPLDGLGAQNIRFGAGGVNLKFTFQPARK
jgi:hypothetical protein